MVISGTGSTEVGLSDWAHSQFPYRIEIGYEAMNEGFLVAARLLGPECIGPCPGRTTFEVKDELTWCWAPTTRLGEAAADIFVTDVEAAVAIALATGGEVFEIEAGRDARS